MNKIIGTLIGMAILVAGCGPLKSETIVKKFSKLEIINNKEGYSLKNKSFEVQTKIDNINNFLDKTIAKVGGKEKVKFAIDHPYLANFLFEIGVKINAIASWDSLDSAIINAQQTWKNNYFSCGSDSTISYVKKNAKNKLTSDGCYQKDGFSEKLVLQDVKPVEIKEHYGQVDKTNYIYNLGYRLNPSAEKYKASSSNAILSTNVNKGRFKSLVPFADQTLHSSFIYLEDTFVILETFGKRFGDANKVKNTWAKFAHSFTELDKLKTQFKNKIPKIKFIRGARTATWVPPKKSTGTSIAYILGGKSMQPDVWKKISIEAILKEDPEYIIVLAHTKHGIDAVRDDLNKEEWFTKLIAYKNKKVIWTNDHVTTSVKLADDLLKIAKDLAKVN